MRWERKVAKTKTVEITGPDVEALTLQRMQVGACNALILRSRSSHRALFL